MTFFILGALVDRFTPAVGAQPQVHPGGDAGLLADAPALQVPLGDGNAAGGIEAVRVVDGGPQVRQIRMAEVLESQVEMDAELRVPDDIRHDAPPSP
ncbi:hypothetical protein [Streptomyces sp. SLBN-118]|uniref:hypothetical protein n=1 Tax=Streptomyces sp. SLBN-118 TaxID=2768454 RepID=UPI0011541611|nr:hypothetical protein [Streptomyces sp. SLBN-118]